MEEKTNQEHCMYTTRQAINIVDIKFLLSNSIVDFSN